MKLEQLQSTEGILLANKLKKSHVEFENQKMKTSLAAQILSLSVAAALQSLVNNKTIGFEKSAATIKFITIVNNMFDIFNSKSKFGGTYKFKSPIDSKTAYDIFKYLDFSMNYLQNLKVSQNGEEKLIVNCKAKTGSNKFQINLPRFCY